MKRLSLRKKELLLNDIVAFAQTFVGAPYVYGALQYKRTRTFDCSSFVRYVYGRFGYRLPRSTIEQAEYIKKTVVGIKNISVGDLVYMHGTRGYYTKQFPVGIGHVALFVGNGMAIHASGSGKKQGVCVERLSDIIRARKPLVVIKRVIV